MKKRTAQLVISFPSWGKDGDCDNSSDDLGDSPKQGRKTDSKTEGRNIDFEESGGGDMDMGIDMGEDQVTEETPQQ